MTIFISLAVFAACVKLLNLGVSVKDVTIIFSVGKVMSTFFRGGGIGTALVVAVVISLLSYGYFRLLNRMSGSGLWWLVLFGGILLLA